MSIKELVSLINEDFIAHGSDSTKPGFQALAIHRIGAWRMGIKNKKLRAPLSVLYRSLCVFARNFYGIELPYTAKIGRRVVFEHQHGIVIHGNAVIGDDCIIRQGVTLGIRRMDEPTEAPTLGNGVNVGAGVKILGNVNVGNNVNIGANAVVLNDIPNDCLAVGIPAKAICVQRLNVAA